MVLSSSLANYYPSDLGLPDQFEDFRECQLEAAQEVLESTLRFNGLALPTGSGKSLIPLMLQKITGKRVVVLTATRGLQAQYSELFASCGMQDIRGKSNYSCEDHQYLSCRFGPAEGCRHHKEVTDRSGQQVQVVDPSCTYAGARKRFQWSSLGVTNYAYWVRANVYGRGLEPNPVEGLNPIEILFLDEAGLAFQELSRALEVVLKEDRLIELLGARKYPQRSHHLGDWKEWATKLLDGSLSGMLAEAKHRHRARPTKDSRDKVYRLEELEEQAQGIQRMRDEDWVLEMKPGTDNGRRWEFQCVWPGARAESRLFVGIPKVVLMGATLRPLGMRMMGIKKEESSFREWPRQFPAQNTPVYHVPTVRMNQGVSADDLAEWVQQIDAIMEVNQDTKGLIHTVSYDRQKFLLEHSRYKHLMEANTKDPESDSAAEAVEKFRMAAAPRALASPSFGTGWDFKDDEARWVIVAKMPFPPFKTKIAEARLKRNPQYTNNLCMQELVQMTGRATRGFFDWSFVYIVDDAVTYFMQKNKGLAPGWFNIIRLARGARIPKARIS